MAILGRATPLTVNTRVALPVAAPQPYGASSTAPVRTADEGSPCLSSASRRIRIFSFIFLISGKYRSIPSITIAPDIPSRPADNSLREDVCDTSTIREAGRPECLRCNVVIHPAWPSWSKHHLREHLAIHANHGNEGSSYSCRGRPRKPQKNSWTSG